MTVLFLDMAYRSFREVLAGLTPASIRRLQSIVITQIPAYLVDKNLAKRAQRASSAYGSLATHSDYL